MEIDILEFMQECRHLAKQALGKHAGEPASGGFARWKHVVIHCFRREEGHRSRETENRLESMTALLEGLYLDEGDVPDFTTLNKSFNRFKMWVWRALLRVSDLRKVWILTEHIECMMGTRRFDVTEHLSEEALDRAINEAQKADEARLVRRLCFVKNLYAGDVLGEAARRVGVSQANSSRWAHAWNDAGVNGLRPSFGGGRPPKLSGKQFAELCDILEEGQPWTPREIHTLIKDRYGVTYDPAHLSRKLRESGMHYAKPRPMDPRRPDDEDEILAERLAEALGEESSEKTEEEEPIVFGFFR